MSLLISAATLIEVVKKEEETKPRKPNKRLHEIINQVINLS